MSLLLFLLGIFLLTIAWAAYRESTWWNNGLCPRCQKRWKHFDTDSQGGRGYKCKNGHYTWISYPVDTLPLASEWIEI